MCARHIYVDTNRQSSLRPDPEVELLSVQYEWDRPSQAATTGRDPRLKKAEQPPVKRMNLNVPVGLHNAFNAATAAQGKNMTDVLMAYIEEYASRHSQLAKKGRRQ